MTALTQPIAPRASESDPELIAAILSTVERETGVDFRHFRPATVRRRIFNRMISVGVALLDDYLELLQREVEEAPLLLERITIKVSRFYRNRQTFDYLRSEVIPRLVSRHRPIRIWCAGCGCGEEAHTLGMLLDEAGVSGDVLATDIDALALASARRASYETPAIRELPIELANRYLDPVALRRGPGYQVCDAVRERVRFQRHDLTSLRLPENEPFDLICCRNVLIYLQRDISDGVQSLLCRALSPRGVLCLGEAEWLSHSTTDLLDTLDSKARVFAAKGSNG